MAINTDQVLVSHSEIEQMLERLSSEINRDYGDETLVVVGILTGAFIFTADLVRRLEMPVIVDFMQVSSYVGEFSTGELKIKKDMSYDIKAMNVLIVEDIIDTGRTLALLKDLLLKRQPKSLKICTAFDEPSRRVNDLVPDYNGITVPDEFIVGYGLDLDGRYRDFDDIRIVRKE